MERCAAQRSFVERGVRRGVRSSAFESRPDPRPSGIGIIFGPGSILFISVDSGSMTSVSASPTTITPTHASPTIAITGANGFIGSQLVRYFSHKGRKVLAFCRAPKDQAPAPNVTFHEFSLLEEPREQEFVGGEVLIHCACALYSKQRPDSDAINIRGTERLLALSRTLGYAKFVFFSSLSAHADAESHYGRHKLALEQRFDLTRDLIVRPGLTLGNGGLARSIFDAIKSNRFVPLVDGGRQPVYTIGVDELGRALDGMLERGLSGSYSLAAREPVSMRELYLGLASKAGVRCVFIPVPYLPVFLALKAAELLGIELSITTENLLGLKQLRTLDLTADLQALGTAPMSFGETLQSLELS